jgi:hypothetical protein
MVSSAAKGLNAEEGIAAVDGGGALEKCERSQCLNSYFNRHHD